MVKKIKQQPSFFAGLSGLQLPVPKYLFPEEFKETSRLTYYATFFNSIEINSTFYKLPMPATVAKWGSQVPVDFKFTFKLWKEITHNKRLEFKPSDVEKFFNVISPADKKKGCVLIQFPPSLGKENIKQLELLLQNIKQYNSLQQWDVAIEFRNKSWYDNKVYDLLNSFKAALVIQDIPKSLTPMIDHQSDFLYVRFHGPTGNYRDSYPDSFLWEYATYIKEWLEEGKNVYVYFNNTMGDAFKNLSTLNQAMISAH